MTVKRQRRSPEFKSKVALAALKGDKTLAQLSSEFGVCSVQISQWKTQLLQQLPNVFQHQEIGRHWHFRKGAIDHWLEETRANEPGSGGDR